MSRETKTKLLVAAMIAVSALTLWALIAVFQSSKAEFRDFCEDELRGETVPGPDGDVCVRGNEVVYDRSAQ